MLRTSLALRKYSPRVELLRTLVPPNLAPADACCWAHLPGHRVAAGLDELLAVLPGLSAAAQSPDSDGSFPVVFPLDHTFPGTGAANASQLPTVVLYAAFGAPCFPSMHSALAGAAASASIRYVLRPVAPPAGCASPGCGSVRAAATTAGDEPLLVGGFGVEMALKNMEYKAIDDSAKQAGGGGEGGADEQAGLGGAEVRGFQFGTLAQRYPGLGAELATFRDALLSGDDGDGSSLKVWDMKDLGVQASARVAASSDPLRLLQDLAQGFPSLAGSLSRMAVNATFVKEVDANQRVVRAGTSHVMINRVALSLDTLDAFSLLDAVTTQLAFADALASLNLSTAAAKQLAALPEPVGGTMRVRFDDAPSVWANDVRKDAAAAKWPTSLRALLTPRFPGRLPSVRRNLYYAILVADPAGEEALAFAESVEYYIASGIPVRFGLVPCQGCTDDAEAPAEEVDDDAAPSVSVDSTLSRRVGRLFAALAASEGDAAAWRWLAAASQARKSDPSGLATQEAAEPLTWEACKAALGAVLSKDTGRANSLLTLASAADSDDAPAASMAASASWARSRGVAQSRATLLLNGMVFTSADVGGQALDYVAVVLAHQEANSLAEAVYTEALAADSDDEEVLEWLHREALPTHNARLVSRDTIPLRVRVPPQPLAGGTPLRYLTAPPHVDAVAAVTHLLVADVSTPHGRVLAAAAVTALARGKAQQQACRLAILHSGLAAGDGVAAPLLPRVVLAASQLGSRRAKLAPFLQAVLTDDQLAGESGDSDAALARVGELADAAGLRGEALVADITAQQAEATLQLAAQAAFVRGGALGGEASQAVGQPGGGVLLSNGRLTVLPPGTPLRPEDFELLTAVELRESASGVAALVEKHLAPAVEAAGAEAPAEVLSDAIAGACFALQLRRAEMETHSRGGAAAGRSPLTGLQYEVSGISMGDVAMAPLVVEGVLDPLSRDAQRLAPLLLLLRDTLGDTLAVRLALNPGRDLADLPLKGYYRFACPPLRGGPLVQAPPPAAHFTSLPAERTLTLGMDVPEPWLVTSLRAPYDLDNLRLEDLGPKTRGFTAAFELEHLLVSGHATDSRATQPPRGVQVTLASGQGANGSVVGTIVMSNLGYFQLKAQPGVHTLAIAPGRSQQLYSIPGGGVTDLLPRMRGHTLRAAWPSGDGADGGGGISEPLAVGDFSGRLLRLRLRKRPGMEKEDVLSGDGAADDQAGAAGGSLWSKTKSFLGGKPAAARAHAGDELVPVGEDNGRIHIFSVASGHLYERFLKIMVLSVLRHTQTPAKFWFIKNYLSPGFKQFLPSFAARYGFEYELITYKWPSWLHKQSEKQRIIWAYKVLFLDVLFPLTLRRVIFVDADQVVRTDMKQLMDMDLRGASLGYTPMCDNNKDMEGYRFWKQGFWKDHLRGRPYHISALYVVDLAAFRALAAGDQFRVLYDNLAKDPNSLANLDQDLPNYAQHQVRIHSLAQEWLWCESWCGNATKAAAKTIDLCNNPMTKEPKLQGARRIVAEWTSLDDEARAFTERVQADAVAAAAGEATHEGRPDAAEL